MASGFVLLAKLSSPFGACPLFCSFQVCCNCAQGLESVSTELLPSVSSSLVWFELNFRRPFQLVYASFSNFLCCQVLLSLWSGLLLAPLAEMPSLFRPDCFCFANCLVSFGGLSLSVQIFCWLRVFNLAFGQLAFVLCFK